MKALYCKRGSAQPSQLLYNISYPVDMIYHKYIRRDISYNAMIYQRYRLGTHATKMRFLGLLDSLLSSGLTADGLEHLSGDILAHALGDTAGHVGGEVLDDGGSGHAVLGGHLGGGVSDVGGTDKELGISLSLPLAVDGVDGGDDVLDVSAGGILVSGDLLADNNGLGGAVGLGVASLSNGDGLGDGLAEGDNRGNDVMGIGEPVSEEELRVGVSIGRGGGEGGGGQKGETKGNHDSQ